MSDEENINIEDNFEMDDGISPEEEAFMKGYEEAGEGDEDDEMQDEEDPEV